MRSSVIDEVRENTDIIQVIGEVVPLKKGGANYMGVCPFHNEKTPSFSISPQKQLFHCFGCKVGGDVFRFVQLYYRWDFRQALEELAKKAGVKVDTFKPDPEWEEGLTILEVATQFFEENLTKKKAEPFREYLKMRKIPEGLWKDFRLGAHLGGFVNILEKKDLSRDIAVRLGLIGRSQRGGYFDRFNGRLIFPILDEKGRTRGFGGRSLGNEHPKYLNSPKSKFFDKSRLFYGMHLACLSVPKREYSVLSEGYLDVIALHEFGVSNALGSMGTALTLDQIRVLKRWSPRVISLYDVDQAGLTATEKNLGNFLREGMEAKVVSLPGAKDPDSFLHETKGSADEVKLKLRQAFENSVPALDFLVKNSVLKEKSAQARGQQLRKLVEILDQVPNEIERTVLKKDLAKRFELPENLLFPQKKAAEMPKQPQRPLNSDLEGGRWERETLKFLVNYGNTQTFSLVELMPYLSSSSKWGSSLVRFIELELDSNAIAQLHWLSEAEEELQAEVRKWAFEAKPDLAEFEIQTIWGDLIKRLKRNYYERESKRLQQELINAENEKNTERTQQILVEKRDLARLMSGSV